MAAPGWLDSFVAAVSDLPAAGYDDAILLALPVIYCCLFLCCLYLPDRAIFLEWLRREHIEQLHRNSRPFKPTSALDYQADECVLCLDQFNIGDPVRALAPPKNRQALEVSVLVGTITNRTHSRSCVVVSVTGR